MLHLRQLCVNFVSRVDFASILCNVTFALSFCQVCASYGIIICACFASILRNATFETIMRQFCVICVDFALILCNVTFALCLRKVCVSYELVMERFS